MRHAGLSGRAALAFRPEGSGRLRRQASADAVDKRHFGDRAVADTIRCPRRLQVVDDPESRPDKADDQHREPWIFTSAEASFRPSGPGSVAAAMLLSTSLRERAMRYPSPAIATSTGSGAVQIASAVLLLNLDSRLRRRLRRATRSSQPGPNGDPAGSGSMPESLMIAFVLIGISVGKDAHRPVERVPDSEIAADRDRVA